MYSDCVGFQAVSFANIDNVSKLGNKVCELCLGWIFVQCFDKKLIGQANHNDKRRRQVWKMICSDLSYYKNNSKILQPLAVDYMLFTWWIHFYMYISLNTGAFLEMTCSLIMHLQHKPFWRKPLHCNLKWHLKLSWSKKNEIEKKLKRVFFFLLTLLRFPAPLGLCTYAISCRRVSEKCWIYMNFFDIAAKHARLYRLAPRLTHKQTKSIKCK